MGLASTRVAHRRSEVGHNSKALLSDYGAEAPSLCTRTLVGCYLPLRFKEVYHA